MNEEGSYPWADAIIGVLRKQEPEIPDPDALEERILQALPAARTRTVWLIAERFLSAAAVALLLVFGAEQFILVSKISRLEEQVQEVGNTPGVPLSAIRIQAAGLDPQEIGKIIHLQARALKPDKKRQP